MTIALTGFMASGKSSVGRILSTLIDCAFIDLDELICKREGKSIAEIFAGGGEKAFRAAEEAALGGLDIGDDMVLALGGGTLDNAGCRQMLANATIAYLRAEESTLSSRLAAQSLARPMLQRHSVSELLARRIDIYESTAGLIIDTDGIDAPQTAVKLARALGYGRFVECCCTDAGEAQEAEAGGASRIELCEQLQIGGVTPSEKNLRKVLSSVNIPVNVLIRPRGGDFVFSESEISQMEDSIRLCKSLGVNGIVIGCLDRSGNVDLDAMRRLIATAGSTPVTFHRAFDVCADPLKAFDAISELGCQRLLTSGHEDDAFTGRALIGELVRRSGGKVTVMAGCGVRPHNICAIESDSHAPEYHSSAHGNSGRTDRDTVSQLVFNRQS